MITRSHWRFTGKHDNNKYRCNVPSYWTLWICILYQYTLGTYILHEYSHLPNDFQSLGKCEYWCKIDIEINSDTYWCHTQLPLRRKVMEWNRIVIWSAWSMIMIIYLSLEPTIKWSEFTNLSCLLMLEIYYHLSYLGVLLLNGGALTNSVMYHLYENDNWMGGALTNSVMYHLYENDKYARMNKWRFTVKQCQP